MSGLRHRLAPLAIPVLAVLSAFIVGSIFLMVTDLEAMARLGSDPLGAFGDAAGSVVAAYQALLMGAFGDPAKVSAAIADPTPRKLAAAIRPLTETLVASTPLIFTGLAVAISFRTSVFNIGVEGQFVLGALGATIAALILRDLAPAPRQARFEQGTLEARHVRVVSRERAVLVALLVGERREHEPVLHRRTVGERD